MPENRYSMPDPRDALTDELIMKEIASGSRVIDLGCGDGRLLAKLRDSHQCTVQGIELDLKAMQLAMQRGVPVIKADLDEGLDDFPEDMFDFAVLSQTLQQVRHPRELIQDMMRIAKRALILVPNFGYWRVRLEVLRHGRTPVTDSLPHSWYETPNLHFVSMHDFRDLMTSLSLRIVQERPIRKGRAVDRVWLANLRADSALYVVERNY